MKVLKEVKRQLINSGEWEYYQDNYEHKQMKFIFSKVALIFNKDLTADVLFEYEQKMAHIDKTKKELTFVDIFKKMKTLTSVKADWEAFGKFMWYVYQTSTYWKDDARNIPNVYTKRNYITINQIKRDLFNDWLHSIDHHVENYNYLIVNTLKKVY